METKNYKHGDIASMETLGKKIVLSMVIVTFKCGKFPPPNNSVINTVADYLFRITNGERINLKSVKDWNISEHFVDKGCAVSLKTMEDILFTAGITENIEYWSKQLDSLNRIEGCDHSEDFEDPFSEFNMSEEQE
jgi:hypothetical protein